MGVRGTDRGRSINPYIEADGADYGYDSVDGVYEMVDAGFEILDGDFDVADGIECVDGASPPMQGTSMLLDMLLLSK